MRHGESKANLKGIIISHPKNGTHIDYALSEHGKEQARESAAKSHLSSKTVLFSSDFSRAVETAQIVQGILGASDVHTTELLRERRFGDWERTPNSNYARVWKLDKDDANHTDDNVESVNSVLERATRLIVELEEKYSNKDILLISHGDTLQILQTGFQKVPPTEHRSLTHLETAEIRPVALAN